MDLLENFKQKIFSALTFLKNKHKKRQIKKEFLKEHREHLFNYEYTIVWKIRPKILSDGKYLISVKQRSPTGVYKFFYDKNRKQIVKKLAF